MIKSIHVNVSHIFYHVLVSFHFFLLSRQINSDFFFFFITIQQSNRRKVASVLIPPSASGPLWLSLGLCDSPLDVAPDVAAVGQLLAIDASGLWTVLWADGTESAVDRMQVRAVLYIGDVFGFY